LVIAGLTMIKIIAILSVIFTASILFVQAVIGGWVVDTTITQLDKTLPNSRTTITQVDNANTVVEDSQTIQKVAKTGSFKGASFGLPLMVVLGAGIAIWRILAR
jgi:hypothetical protein